MYHHIDVLARKDVNCNCAMACESSLEADQGVPSGNNWRSRWRIAQMSLSSWPLG